tara:strand:- start:3392 stop:4468 length:1077 start_codon:yes stop_codon:yes gene_type:complete
MSIFGSLGKLFGYKGASAEAFGGSFAEKASTTFTDRINKSIDSFESEVKEKDKLLLIDELEEAKMSKEELNEALKGIKEKVAIGWSPGVSAAIHSAPPETQKIMIDAANSMEDKSQASLDKLWKTSVQVNKEIPQLSIMDAAKLLVGNQIPTEFNYETIPETDNILSKLGFNVDFRQSLKDRVARRPNMRPDLSVDTDAIIPTGGPSPEALASSQAYRKTPSTSYKGPKSFEEIAARATNNINTIMQKENITADDISTVNGLEVVVNDALVKSGKFSLKPEKSIFAKSETGEGEGISQIQKLYLMPTFISNAAKLLKDGSAGNIASLEKYKEELRRIRKNHGDAFANQWSKTVDKAIK